MYIYVHICIHNHTYGLHATNSPEEGRATRGSSMQCVDRLLPTRRRWSSWAPNAQHGLRETAVDSTWWENHGKTMGKPWKMMENDGKSWENHGNIMGKYSIRSNLPAFGNGEAMGISMMSEFGWPSPGLPHSIGSTVRRFFYELTARSVEWCSRGSYPQISLISG